MLCTGFHRVCLLLVLVCSLFFVCVSACVFVVVVVVAVLGVGVTHPCGDSVLFYFCFPPRQPIFCFVCWSLVCLAFCVFCLCHVYFLIVVVYFNPCCKSGWGGFNIFIFVSQFLLYIRMESFFIFYIFLLCFYLCVFFVCIVTCLNKVLLLLCIIVLLELGKSLMLYAVWRKTRFQCTSWVIYTFFPGCRAHRYGRPGDVQPHSLVSRRLRKIFS